MDSPLTVAALVTQHPRAVAVLQRHLIDFCCGGARPLAEACGRANISLETLMDELHAEEARFTSPDTRWDLEPLPRLITHLLERYHAPLWSELPRLRAMATKVLRVHGDKDARIAEINVILSDLADELEQHMRKEEQVLFPMIGSGRGSAAGGPVAVMHAEHDSAGEALRAMRRLTDGYTPPAEACGTWRALWQGLEALEAELHAHIHLENNILFPRALRGGR